MKYIIKNSNGTYYQKMTGIGPMFGGTKDEAMEFDTKIEAGLEMTKHSFAFATAEVEEKDNK